MNGASQTPAMSIDPAQPHRVGYGRLVGALAGGIAVLGLVWLPVLFGAWLSVIFVEESGAIHAAVGLIALVTAAEVIARVLRGACAAGAARIAGYGFASVAVGLPWIGVTHPALVPVVTVAVVAWSIVWVLAARSGLRRSGAPEPRGRVSWWRMAGALLAAVAFVLPVIAGAGVVFLALLGSSLQECPELIGGCKPILSDLQMIIIEIGLCLAAVAAVTGATTLVLRRIDDHRAVIASGIALGAGSLAVAVALAATSSAHDVTLGIVASCVTAWCATWMAFTHWLLNRRMSRMNRRNAH